MGTLVVAAVEDKVLVEVEAAEAVAEHLLAHQLQVMVEALEDLLFWRVLLQLYLQPILGDTEAIHKMDFPLI
jgi:hypothetical protein